MGTNRKVSGSALFAWSGLKDANVELVLAAARAGAFERLFVLFKDSDSKAKPARLAAQIASRWPGTVLVPVGGPGTRWDPYDSRDCHEPVDRALRAQRRAGMLFVSGKLAVLDETGTQAQRSVTKECLLQLCTQGAEVSWFVGSPRGAPRRTEATTWDEEGALRRCEASLDEQIVLVTGRTGVGKSAFAKKLAERWRPGKLFVALNCAGLSSELADSLLFGHAKGAFTGADKAHPGAFRSADGGVLFLDEVGELEERVQAKLLLALSSEEGSRRRFRPLGATAEATSDLRVICATNRQLWTGSDRRIRTDLLARISDYEVELPSLAERRDPAAIAAAIDETLARHGTTLDPPAREEVDALVRSPDSTWEFNWRDVVTFAKWMVAAAGAAAGTRPGKGRTLTVQVSQAKDASTRLRERWDRARQLELGRLPVPHSPFPSDAPSAAIATGTASATVSERILERLTVPERLLAKEAAQAFSDAGGNLAAAWALLVERRFVHGGEGNRSHAMRMLRKRLGLGAPMGKPARARVSSRQRARLSSSPGSPSGRS